MTTDYDLIAAEYKRAKQQPWRMHLEHHTLFHLLGDLHGKAVLDLACGEDFYTRFLKRGGAARAMGVDLSQRMIDLAIELRDLAAKIGAAVPAAVAAVTLSRSGGGQSRCRCEGEQQGGDWG